MQLKLKILFVLGLITLSSCSLFNKKTEESYSYLALGDSYTIGEGVNSRNRWPVQLADALRDMGMPVMNPNIIAKTGWRTDDLWNGMIDEVKSSRKYNIVSLMIGVNNQYQHKSMISFEAELEALIDKASAKCAYGEEGVFLMSIPDYGVTPFAGEKSEGVSKELRDWNAAILKVSKKKNVQHFDITPLSRKAVNDTSLLAPDRLHPSGKMYKEWVEQIAESVYIRLKANIKVFPNE